MTFEEWWAQEDRVYANEYSTFKMVAAQAWSHQQRRIEKLEWDLDMVKYALEEQKKLNSFLNGRLEALQDDLKENANDGK